MHDPMVRQVRASKIIHTDQKSVKVRGRRLMEAWPSIKVPAAPRATWSLAAAL